MLSDVVSSMETKVYAYNDNRAKDFAHIASCMLQTPFVMVYDDRRHAARNVALERFDAFCAAISDVFSKIADIRVELDDKKIVLKRKINDPETRAFLAYIARHNEKPMNGQREVYRAGTVRRTLEFSAVDEWQSNYVVRTEVLFHWSYLLDESVNFKPGTQVKIRFECYVKRGAEWVRETFYNFDRNMMNLQQEAGIAAERSIRRTLNMAEKPASTVGYRGPMLPYPEKPYD